MIARTTMTLALTAALAACAPAGDSASGNKGEERRSGQTGAVAPVLESQTLDGKPVALDSLRGTPVLLNIWATWCHPCRDEIPVLQALHEQYAPRGLRIVGVTIDDAGSEDDIQSFAKEFGMTYTVWHDPDQRVMPSFSVVGVPTTFLIGRDGRVIWRKTGEVKHGDPVLAAALDSALAVGN